MFPESFLSDFIYIFLYLLACLKHIVTITVYKYKRKLIVPRQYFCCSFSLFVHSIFEGALFDVVIHIIKFLSDALRELCSIDMEVPEN